MSGVTIASFREVWLVDFEFSSKRGERPSPICLVAYEMRTKRTIRLWGEDLRSPLPPYPTARDCLFVSYYAPAELGCHLALQWPLPESVLDLFAEFRVITNGRENKMGNSFLAALSHFGLDGIAALEKDEMRHLAIRGGPFSSTERESLLEYCAGDVSSLERLLRAMLPQIDLPRALHRGRYLKAVSRMEHLGIPIDVASFEILKGNWKSIQDQLISRIDRDYGVFEGKTFKIKLWERWLGTNGIAWPRLPSGTLDLKDETFREMARKYPSVAPIRELRNSLSQMRLSELAIGQDGRNRCMLSPFRSRTGRNQPSNTKFVFGPSVWLRSLISPPKGCAIAYLDWSEQEIGIPPACRGI